MEDGEWEALAYRIVQGLDVQAGELIQIRGDPGSYEFLLEVLLAVESAGATPLPEIFNARYLQRLWSGAPLEYLAQWDHRRAGWMEKLDRIISFVRPNAGSSVAPEERRQAWQRAIERLTVIEEARRLPFLVVVVPGEDWAGSLGIPYETLKSTLLPALIASPEALRAEIERVLDAVNRGKEILIHSGDGYLLRMAHGERMWLGDDGLIDAEDRRKGAIVSNLPAGSVYTTVLESETSGKLFLPAMEAAREAVLTFRGGRIVDIAAESGAEALKSWIFSYTGEPGRISHIGIGLNPHLTQPTGWHTIVDEHVRGIIFFALGENRYMGGENESTLNADYIVPNASFIVDGKAIVLGGKVVV